MSKIHNTMRELIVKAAYTAKHGHIPSALSIVEIMQSYHDIETQDDVIAFNKKWGVELVVNTDEMSGAIA